MRSDKYKTEYKPEKKGLSPAVLLAYWIISVLLWEGTLHFSCLGGLSGLGWNGLFIVGFSLVLAFALTAVSRLFGKTFNRILLLALSLALGAFYGLQVLSFKQTGTFFSGLSGADMSGSVGQNVPALILMALPFLGAIVLQFDRFGLMKRRTFPRTLIVAGLAMVIFSASALCLGIGEKGASSAYAAYYGSKVKAEERVSFFGAATALRLDVQAMIFGSAE